MTTARPAPLDDRSLMRDVQAGKSSALAALYERTVSVLYPLALRISGAPERACLVMEELFDEVWRDRSALRPGHGIPLGSLIRRCRELSLAQSGPESKRPMTAEAGASGGRGGLAGEAGGGQARGGHTAGGHLTTEPGAIRVTDIPGDDLGPFVSRQAACDALDALPERDRMALEEAFFCGTNANKIASMVGTPTSEAEAMLRSALVRFRNHIDSPESIESLHSESLHSVEAETRAAS
jgi:DNA-directed RNA polymerase specialized sigma24 family protein